MILIYSVLGATTTSLSAVATGLIIHRLLFYWDLRVSSVRWLFFMFFVFLFIWTTSRCTFFAWMLIVGDRRRVDHTIEKVLTTTDELDSLGIHSIPISNLARNGPLAFVVLVGDVALFALALWMFALTYELAKIARKSMDRGPAREAKRIRLYSWIISSSILAFASVETGIAIREGGYTIPAHKCLLVNFAAQGCGLGFMFSALVYLKIRGRKYEAMHGVLVVSPVYQRLKRILIVYACFATQFQAASVILCTTGERRPCILSFIGISMVIYNCTGLALGIITGCSQSCVFQVCSACMPADMEAQFMQRQFGATNAGAAGVDPPVIDPVFVFTDIEGSSAAWALAPVGVMDTATDIHDTILRSSLPRHHGYEITTCGDSFQLAFPTIREAVAYCSDVQLQLLVAPWPKALHGLTPATQKQRRGHRLIFSGLRVRMGIHDSVARDGALVCTRHAVTGKMTYTGVSEAVARGVSDVGGGGQILATRRVAAWVADHRDELDVAVAVEYVGHVHLEVLGSSLDVFSLLPSIVAARRKHWLRATAEQLATPLLALADRPDESRAVVARLPGTPSADARALSIHEIEVRPHGTREGRVPAMGPLKTMHEATED